MVVNAALINYYHDELRLSLMLSCIAKKFGEAFLWAINQRYIEQAS